MTAAWGEKKDRGAEENYREGERESGSGGEGETVGESLRG
jgi:hypothetical protein